MKTLTKIGRVVRNARESNQMSQLDLAEAARGTQCEVSGIERGTANVTLKTLLKYCKVLNLRLRVLGGAKKG